MRKPCFENLQKVLRCEKPSRPTLFEFFLNDKLNEQLAKLNQKEGEAPLSGTRQIVAAFHRAGYDYAFDTGSDFTFSSGEVARKKSYSINDGSVIWDRESFCLYSWPEPEDFDYSRLEEAKEYLPDGMKLLVSSHFGVLENAIKLVGYETLCVMLIDEEELLGEIFEAIGSRILRHYEICVKYDTVGGFICADDWGFNTQTMLSPDDLRKYVFPWYKKIVELAHKHNKFAILHSCGQLKEVMEDIIEDMKFDGKHSFEDKIEPVEEAYEKWGGRIAILGGIDLDFICRGSLEEIRSRAVDMLKRSRERGGYALGTGNSVPDYLPVDHYLELISVVTGERLDINI